VPLKPLSILVLCALGVGCASFRPQLLDSLPFKERAQTQERDGLRVTVSVLSRSEAKQAFGVDLERQQIQPVWIEIENRSRLLPT
jgi:hypothetical protein